jgi:hypothetical protein
MLTGTAILGDAVAENMKITCLSGAFTGLN